jgi:imidazolonepropionase-like amidohydrolase
LKFPRPTRKGVLALAVSTICLAVLAAGVLTKAAAPHAQPPASTTRVFTGARLIDGTGRPPITNGILIVRDGRIVAAGSPASIQAPAGAERISLDGKTVIPGLINSHGHVSDVDRDLRVYGAYGVTTVFSLGGESAVHLAARERQSAGSLDRTRIFVAGAVVSARTPDDARKQVAENAALKTDLIKIRVDDNLGTAAKMAPEVYRAVIDEAHARRLRVAAHVFYLEDAKRLLDAGVDLIAHSVRDTDIDAATLAAWKAKNVCLVPTLMREVSTFVYESTPPFFSDPQFLAHADAQQVARFTDPKEQASIRASAAARRYKAGLDVALRNVKTLSDAGVGIAMGTDSGTGLLGRFVGYFELMELELMAKAGLTPSQILASATRDAARCLELDAHLGTLEPGKWADFVVLDADPLADIRHVRRIASVWIAGNRVKR